MQTPRWRGEGCASTAVSRRGGRLVLTNTVRAEARTGLGKSDRPDRREALRNVASWEPGVRPGAKATEQPPDPRGARTQFLIPTESRWPRVMRWRPARAQRSVDRGARRPAIEPRNSARLGCRRARRRLKATPVAAFSCQWPSVSPQLRPENSPLVATNSPHWWPPDLPTGGAGSGQGPHPLAGGCLGESVAVLPVGDDHVGVVQEPLDGRGGQRFGHQLVEPGGVDV